MTKRKFTVTGMSCSACSAAVERAARSVEGVTDAAVSLLTGTMVTEYDEGVASPEVTDMILFSERERELNIQGGIPH